MTISTKTSAEWQDLLDVSFPEGAAVSPVRPDGSLTPDGAHICPVLVVMTMDGEWPFIVGIADDGRDVQLRISSWEEIDRDGHYAARAGTESGQVEISSWLSPAAVQMMASVRDSQREWLLQVAESAQAESPAPASPEML